MISSYLAPIVVVQHAGEQNSPITANMHDPGQGRVAIIHDGDKSVGAVPRLVLRAFGKRRGVGPFPPSAPGVPGVADWLKAEGVTDLFIGRSDQLSGDQLNACLALTPESRLWLIYPSKCDRQDLLAGFDFEVELHSETRTRFVGLRRRRRQSWEDFPLLPIAELLRFRAACKEVLAADEMRRLEHALSMGLTHALHVIDDALPLAPEGPDLLLPAMGGDVPMWPAFAMLRGAQMGALARGLRMDFDTAAFLQARGAVAYLTDGAIAALREPCDPEDGAMVSIYTATFASTRLMQAIRCSDVDGQGEGVRVKGTRYPISDRVSGLVRAHRSARLSIGEDDPLLFVTMAGNPHTPKTLGRSLTRRLAKCGLPATCQQSYGIPGTGDDATHFASHIKLRIAPLIG